MQSLKLFKMRVFAKIKINPPVVKMFHFPLKRTLYFFVFFFISISALAQEGSSEQKLFKKFTILYTNDLHSHLEPHIVRWVSETRAIGGFANIAALVKDEKKNNPNTIYLDAGDYFTGPYISYITEGKAVIDVMNKMKIDAAGVGNHEFDHGWGNVVKQFKRANFPILNGNIFLENTSALLWDKPYMILKTNGVKVGLIGLHGKFAFYDTISEEMIQGVEARDEEVYLKQYLKELEGKADIIILLAHQGIPGRQSSTGNVDVSRNLQKDIELAQNVPGIDIIITGHAHQGTPEPLLSGQTLIVSTDALGIQLGKLDITYDQDTDKIISYSNKLQVVFDDEIEDDKKTKAVIDKWKIKSSKIAAEKVSLVTENLTRSYGDESLLGNMVADAILHSFPDNDFAVVNSGGLRQDIPAGTITVGDIISAFPFPNTVVKAELTGIQILEVFEHAASLSNGVLQVSKGVIFIYDENRPLGKRLVSLQIQGELVQKDRIYKVLVPNFVSDGGDGYLAFTKALNKKNTNELVTESIKKYLSTFPTYQAKIEGRIIKK